VQPPPVVVSRSIPLPFGRTEKRSLDAAEVQRPNAMRPFEIVSPS
jgi:hypothetical protein